MTIMTRAAMVLIRFYQRRISPKLGYVCPETPSCSQYALEAFQEHGFLKGVRMTHYRLSTCDRRQMIHPMRILYGLICGLRGSYSVHS